MQHPEAEFGAGLPIDSIGPGFFRVAGEVVRGPILIHAGGVAPWGGYDDVAPILELRDRVDVLFVGTGGDVAHLPRALLRQLEAADMMVEAMATAAAARGYNLLLAEGRRIAAALLPLPAAAG
jgi:uncharacterized protein